MHLESSTLKAPTNSTNGSQSPRNCKVLQTLGMNSGRVNLYPGAYLRGLDWDQPDTSNLEATLLAAHSVQVQPVLLFEYYSRFLNTTGLGTEAQWQQLGAVFAARFRPNGTFWREHGGDEYFGISVYTAFNEPDDSTGFCPGRAPGPAPYLAALRGLAAGVHSVDPSLVGGLCCRRADLAWCKFQSMVLLIECY